MTDADSGGRSGWIEQIVRHWGITLLAGCAITIAALPASSRLTFEQSIASLYAHDDPHLRAFQRSQSHFGGDEFVIVAYVDPELDAPAGRTRLRQFAERFSELPGIAPRSVQDLATVLGSARLAFIPERKLKALFQGVLVGPDNQTTAVVMRLAPEGPPAPPRAETFRQIRALAAEFTRATQFETYVVGEPIHIHEMFRYVEEDGFWLWVYSTGLMFFVILGLFRSLRWTLLPVLVVAAAVIWTRALLVLSGLELSMVSSMLNSLVTIIGMATVIHIAVHFRELRPGLPPADALIVAGSELAGPILWTCLTTAAGFGVLVSSAIRPVASFGLMMCLGSIVIIPVTLLLVPGGALVGGRGFDLGRAPLEAWLGRVLDRISDVVERHPRIVTLATLAITVFSLAGFYRLRVETDFSRNFRDSSDIVRGLNFVEGRLGGAGSWEVNFPAPSELTPEFLEEVRGLTADLRRIAQDDGAQLSAISLTDGLDLVPTIPLISRTLEQKLALLARFQPEFAPSLYDPIGQRMRIVLRARERQSSEAKLRLMAAVEAAADKRFRDSETTGLFVLLTFLIESLMRDQWVSFVLAGGAIWLLMSIAFRSAWIGLISLAPNVFPIVLVIGSMGWGGMPINIATAMIASVSMGLTVDSSIHFLAGFTASRKRGTPFQQALRQTNQGVGRALVFANLALILGFLVLTASHFIPLVYFGVLVGVAMAGGLVGNLVLLPLLLQIGERRDIQQHSPRPVELKSGS